MGTRGCLHAVIDFGSLAVGDPACDAMIAWQFFDEEGRYTFCRHLGYDEATWLRGRAWASWKAAIVAAGIVQSNAVEMDHCWRTLARVVRG